MTYKGYSAEIKVDLESGLLHGQVLGIKDVVAFEAETVKQARENFEKKVEEYLQFCRETGQEPNKPFSGKLPFRTTPEIHRAIYIAASKAGKSINSWMEEVLKDAAERHVSPEFNS